MSEAFDLAWMQGIDDDFTPGTMTAKVESLVDGEYEFEVGKAQKKIIEAKNMLIIEMEMEVLTPGKHQGQKIQHSIFITDLDSLKRATNDLMKLGFDCGLWTPANGRPVSKEILKVHKALKGMRFKAKKATKDNKYHNLYIKSRMLPDGKPEVIGPEQLDAFDPDEPF